MDLSLYIFLSFCMVITLLYLIIGKQDKKLPWTNSVLSQMLVILLAFIFGLSKVDIYGDKWVYKNAFESINASELKDAKDIGWFYYTKFIKGFTSSSDFYFVLTALVYTAGYLFFSSKFFFKEYQWYFLIATVLSFGFSAYAVNTIRSGFALSLLLVAICFYKKPIMFVLFAFLAVSCHKSMLLPAVAFGLTYFYNQPKFFFYFWFLCLIISFVNVSAITNVLTPLLAGEDDRLQSYFDLGNSDSKRYKSGFRWDFIFYSAIPLFVASFYVFKLKVQDLFYNRLLSTYLLSNAVWLLVIRMAFTDRVATLSWFLIPSLLLYPLLKYKLALNQRNWVFFVLLGIFAFTSFMYFK